MLASSHFSHPLHIFALPLSLSLPSHYGHMTKRDHSGEKSSSHFRPCCNSCLMTLKIHINSSTSKQATEWFTCQKWHKCNLGNFFFPLSLARNLVGSYSCPVVISVTKSYTHLVYMTLSCGSSENCHLLTVREPERASELEINRRVERRQKANKVSYLSKRIFNVPLNS